MELDELKRIIKSKSRTANEEKDEISMENIKKGKTSNPVDTLRKKLIIEYIVGLAFFIVMIVIFMVYNEYFHMVSIWVFITLSTIIMITTALFIIKVYRMVKYNDSTRVFLEKFLATFKSYLKLAERSILIFVPLFYLAGYISGVQLGAPERNLEILFLPRNLALMFGIVILVTALLYYLVKLLYKRFYYKNLNELQQLIEEFDTVQ